MYTQPLIGICNKKKKIQKQEAFEVKFLNRQQLEKEFSKYNLKNQKSIATPNLNS